MITTLRSQRFRRPDRTPVLRFSPTVWAQLRFLRDAGPTEVGAFGISSRTDLWSVQELAMVSQRCSSCTVAFDDLAVADYFEEQVDRGRHPEEFARIWIHTHPGNSARPSSVDRETQQRCFGVCDWSIMVILACNENVFAELSLKGTHCRIPLRVELDLEASFPATDHSLWSRQYTQSVHAELLTPSDFWNVGEEAGW